MAKTTEPQFDQDLGSAIDQLFSDKSVPVGGPPAAGPPEPEPTAPAFPEALARWEGAGVAASSVWTPPPNPVLEAISAVSAEAAALAEHLAAIDAHLLHLEWDASDSALQALLQELHTVLAFFPESPSVHQLIDLIHQVLDNLHNLPRDLNRVVLQFLGQSTQTLTSVCAQELHCPVDPLPDLKAVERQFMLLQTPPTDLSSPPPAAARDLGAPAPLIPWDQLDGHLIPFDRFLQKFDDLLHQLSELTGISREISSRQAKLQNLISDFFLRYLSSMQDFGSGHGQPPSSGKGFFGRRRSARAPKAAAEHQNWLRLGEFLEGLEATAFSLRQSTQVLDGHLRKLSDPLADISQVIIAEVVLIKVAGRIFAIPARNVDQVVRWDSFHFGGQEIPGGSGPVALIDLHPLLGLPDEGFDAGPDALIVKVDSRYGALRPEEIYGREIIIFARLDAASGSPYLAGVGMVEGNVFYLLNLRELLRT